MRNAPPGQIGLISNRNSGHNRERLGEISVLLDRCPNIHHVATDSVTEIPAVLERFAALGISHLAINGGDGTASAILGQALDSGLFPELPQVILLPGGTANMNAGDIGVRGRLAGATRRLCRWAQGDHAERQLECRERVLMRVQIEPQAKPSYGMFLGAGAVMQGTEYAHREIHSRGLRDDFSVALGTLRTVWGVTHNDPAFARPVAIDLQLDDGEELHSHDTMILAVSSLQRLFFGMQPFWASGPGALRVTLIEQGSHRFMRTFFSIARGRPNADAIPEQGYFSHNAGRIRLHMTGSLNLDGEILHASLERGPVTISATPPFTFLRL